MIPLYNAVELSLSTTEESHRCTNATRENIFFYWITYVLPNLLVTLRDLISWQNEQLYQLVNQLNNWKHLKGWAIFEFGCTRWMESWSVNQPNGILLIGLSRCSKFNMKSTDIMKINFLYWMPVDYQSQTLILFDCHAYL